MTSCAPAPDVVGSPPHTFNDLNVTMLRTICNGTCPMYAVEISGDRHVTFCGVMWVQESGERTRRIGIKSFRKIISAMEEADFWNLNDEYFASVTDHPTTIVEIRQSGRTKSVVDYVAERVGMPASMTQLEDVIDEVAGTADWIGEWQGSHYQGFPACGHKYFEAPLVVEPDFRPL